MIVSILGIVEKAHLKFNFNIVRLYNETSLSSFSYQSKLVLEPFGRVFFAVTLYFFNSPQF